MDLMWQLDPNETVSNKSRLFVDASNLLKKVTGSGMCRKDCSFDRGQMIKMHKSHRLLITLIFFSPSPPIQHLSLSLSHTHTHTHTHTQTHIHTHTFTHTHSHTHVYMYSLTHPSTHAHTHTHTHAPTCTHAHAHTHTHLLAH